MQRCGHGLLLHVDGLQYISAEVLLHQSRKNIELITSATWISGVIVRRDFLIIESLEI